MIVSGGKNIVCWKIILRYFGHQISPDNAHDAQETDYDDDENFSLI